MNFVGRNIIFHESHFIDFYLEQPLKVQEKIEYVFRLIRQLEKVPKKFFDHMKDSDGLFEIRVELGSNIYRIFSCFDEGNIVVLFNGFQKKTQKTPKQEIEKAERLKKEYFELKNRKK